MRRAARAFLLLLGLLAISLAARPARAQDSTFSLDRLRIGAAPNDGIGVWRPELGDEARLFGQFTLGFSYNPFRIEHHIQDDAQASQMAAVSGAPVKAQFTGYTALGLELFERFSFQAMFPATFGQGGSSTSATGVPAAQDAVNLAVAAPGDTRFEVRVVLFKTDDDFFKLGANANLFAPSGSNDSFTGDASTAGGFGAAGELDWKDFILVLDTGAHFRPTTGVNDFDVGHEVNYGLGGFLPLEDGRIRLGLELFGSVQVAGVNAGKAETSPLEWMAEGRFALDDAQQLYLNGFGGTRMTPGYAPDFRTGLAFGWWFNLADNDPKSPQKEKRFEMNDKLDTDGDGYPDSVDLCPTEKEDGKPPFATDGCPGNDRDGDGIPDALDKCPDEPEDKDGIDDKDGCPEDDADKDGIPDAEDACPKEPGVKSPQKDKNGCPQFIRRITGSNEIQILKKVEFQTGSANLRPDSFPILDEIHSLLLANPEITKLAIEGHTDSNGSNELNMTLSKGRARSCLDYLIKKGIASGRLTSEGFGEDRPIDTNDTADGRAKNRRTEFHIRDQSIGGGGGGGDAPKKGGGDPEPGN